MVQQAGLLTNMHNKTPKLVHAIRSKQFGQAQQIFSRIMTEKVEDSLAGERKTLATEAADKCVHCGSRKDLEVIDGSAICAECDPER